MGAGFTLGVQQNGVRVDRTRGPSARKDPRRWDLQPHGLT